MAFNALQAAVEAKKFEMIDELIENEQTVDIDDGEIPHDAVYLSDLSQGKLAKLIRDDADIRRKR